MRIRLTLDIKRRRPQREQQQPERDVEMGALVERAEPHPIGFTADPGRIAEPTYRIGGRP